MSNISTLFENLMTYNEVNKSKASTLKERRTTIKEDADTTLINLSVEVPKDVEEIKPEDVTVDVGVMNVDTSDVEKEDDKTDDENVDEVVVDETEDEIKDETKDKDEKEKSDKEEPEKEESLDLTKEGVEEVEEGSTDFESAVDRIRKRVNGATECTDVKTESLMHLDAASLNRLITTFVKDNYKNIDKVVINKAVLENRKLTLTGKIFNSEGKMESIALINRGFDAAKLEGKRFIMDFRDGSNTFGVIKENLKNPFVFTATVKNGKLAFEKLNCSFKTRINESKVAEITGKYTLKESLKTKNEKVEPKNENADQVKKFNEIVDKIKAAKNANDLIACKDEMDESNIGDTLLSAAQMVWDDVNSRMVASTK